MTFADVRTYVKGLLTKSFANKTVLDKISEDDNGKINYNNSPIQDSYSKEEFDEILKSDYKQIFDKDSNVELLEEPVSFTAPKSSANGTGTPYNIKQNLSLKQSIESFDALIFSISTVWKDNTQKRIKTIFVKISQLEFNNSEELDTTKIITLNNIWAASASGAYGNISSTLQIWFKDLSNIYVYNIDNSMSSYALTFTIESIIGTKFHSTEIYKETSVLNTPTNYSLEEKCIGSWINGKPLYQKTVYFGAMSTGGSKNVSHGIENIDTIWIYDGYVKNSTGTFIGLTNAHTSDVNGSWNFNVNKTYITNSTGTENRSAYIAYVVLQYTKTTDEENSFTPDMLSTDEIDDTITDEDIENLMAQIKEG